MLRKMYRGLLSKMHEWSAEERSDMRWGDLIISYFAVTLTLTITLPFKLTMSLILTLTVSTLSTQHLPIPRVPTEWHPLINHSVNIALLISSLLILFVQFCRRKVEGMRDEAKWHIQSMHNIFEDRVRMLKEQTLSSDDSALRNLYQLGSEVTAVRQFRTS